LWHREKREREKEREREREREIDCVVVLLMNSGIERGAELGASLMRA
jgi:hypothetical protein